MKIGLFDSGLGGLSIAREIFNQLPQYDYLYLGDNARLPYGGRSPELIFDFTKQAVQFLFERDCELVILACNTASATALRRIQQEYLPLHFPKRHVLGVIRPICEAVLEAKLQRVGVVGTDATIGSKAYTRELEKVKPQIEVFQQACPLLVPMIEEGVLDSSELKLLFARYLSPLLDKQIQGLILGCTHYGLIQQQIEAYLGNGIKVFPTGTIVAQKLADYLRRHTGIEQNLSKESKRTFYVTDLHERYEVMAQRFLKDDSIKLELISL